MQQRLQEEEESKAELMRSLINAEETGGGKNKHLYKKKLLTYFSPENESIMKINQFLETSLKEGKISNSLYNHLKSN